MVAKTIQDVHKAILFATQYDIKITVKSSEHDYNGRDTWHGSLMINLGNMPDMTVTNVTARAPDGEIIVESGASWMEVYTKVFM